MKQYIVRFLKARFLVIFGGATLFYELFFYVLLWCKTAAFAPPSALRVYVPALAWYLLDILLTFRFRQIIRYQERLFHVKFSDTNAAALYPESNTFLSDDWLIFSGEIRILQAVHKTHFHRGRANEQGQRLPAEAIYNGRKNISARHRFTNKCEQNTALVSRIVLLLSRPPWHWHARTAEHKKGKHTPL
ncbi:MAG: hypothetical protein MR552_05790 [Clostridiales bacterium]|nr:hypothetical protein [Clostridiales bacterium]